MEEDWLRGPVPAPGEASSVLLPSLCPPRAVGRGSGSRRQGDRGGGPEQGDRDGRAHGIVRKELIRVRAGRQRTGFSAVAGFAATDGPLPRSRRQRRRVRVLSVTGGAMGLGSGPRRAARWPRRPADIRVLWRSEVRPANSSEVARASRIDRSVPGSRGAARTRARVPFGG